jgi:hypothetical protein
MSMKLPSLISILAVLAMPVEGLAQAAGPPNAGAAGRQEPGADILTRDTLSASDLKRLAEKIDQWNRVEGKQGVAPRVAKARTTAMLAVLKVSCVVSDAAYRGPAPDKAEQIVYEAACEDGMGYLLFLQKSSLTGTSCLAVRPDDSAVRCALPANADQKVMAASVLARYNLPCKVRDVKWLGVSAANLEHVEVACENEAGYVLRNPPPGATGKLDVISCEEAGKQGVACSSTPPAPAPGQTASGSRPTLSWFKEALARNGVSCQSKRARIVGRESIKRRYLVEFECADRPEGLVAVVPPEGDNVNTFESMNCASAAKRGIRCEWMSAESSQRTQ